MRCGVGRNGDLQKAPSAGCGIGEPAQIHQAVTLIPPAEPPLRENINDYLRTTGFPDLGAVSSRIVKHAKSVIFSVAPKLGLRVRLLAYDGTCSVGQKKALPGSDLDELTVVVEPLEAAPGPHLWETIRAMFIGDNTLKYEKYKAQELQAAFYSNLDFELIGCDQSLKVIFLRELQSQFSRLFPYAFDPRELYRPKEAEIVALLLDSGEIIFNDLEEVAESWGNSKIFNRFRRSANEWGAFVLPKKFKVQARANLVTQFNLLDDDERLLIIEILRSDVSTGKSPSALSNAADNPFIEVAKKLEEKRLLFLLDPTCRDMIAAIELTKHRLNILGQNALNNIIDKRYLAPWKLSNPDNMLLSHYFDPKGMHEVHKALVALKNPEALPITLSDWWYSIHKPGLL